VDDLSFQSYWDIIQFNTQLFTFELWVEGLRQWLVIVSTVALSILFFVSLLKLRRTQHGLDIDQVILMVEIFKVSAVATD